VANPQARDRDKTKVGVSGAQFRAQSLVTVFKCPKFPGPGALDLQRLDLVIFRGRSPEEADKDEGSGDCNARK
jgi:hypothetical protein